MASTPKPHYIPSSGDVEIVLGKHEFTLKCSLQAGLAISRLSGGIRGAIDKITQMDIDTIATVIRHGIGPEEAKRYKNLELLVYENGLMDSQGGVLGKVIEYLSNLARGGRSVEDADRETAQGQSEAGEQTLN